MSESLFAPPAVDYPSSDGQPMAENDWQLHAIFDAFGALDAYFKDQPDVYVSGDLLIYYEEGNPKARVAPDVFVVLGAAKHKRMTYKLWEEPKVPDFVMEIASPGTWREDAGPKRRLYARLGVGEYWRYDPTGEHFTPRLQGLKLQGNEYRPLAAQWKESVRVLYSEALGLELRELLGGEMRFHDRATGRNLLSYREEHAAHQQEAAAHREEAAARRREAAARQQEAAARQRETVARQAAEARAEAAEARIAELEALLREKRG